jgi:hypothetical protein
MAKKAALVTIADEGVIEVHLPSAVSGDYATLCGMDGTDCGQQEVTTDPASVVTCPHCCGIWLTARSFTARHINATVLRRCAETIK